MGPLMKMIGGLVVVLLVKSLAVTAPSAAQPATPPP
jgi:hypothetical protein